MCGWTEFKPKPSSDWPLFGDGGCGSLNDNLSLPFIPYSLSIMDLRFDASEPTVTFWTCDLEVCLVKTLSVLSVTTFCTFMGEFSPLGLRNG